jgi:predicted metal-binding membrane protein
VAEATALERLVRRDRAITVASLIVLCLLAWAYVLAGAGMGQPTWRESALPGLHHEAAAPSLSAPMPGMAMSGMRMPATPPGSAWSLTAWLLAAAMWVTMMVAMMTPSAAPAILLYARVVRQPQAGAEDRARTASPIAFTGGYLLIWLIFSVAAASLQLTLVGRGWLTADLLSLQSRGFSAAVLFTAGAYQLVPWHDVCLQQCRSPAAFLSRHWRPGLAGAIRLGVLHGAYCVGCCWALMALLFVGGVMNLVWIAALTLLVAAEKLLPWGPQVGRTVGAVLIAGSLAILLL